MTSSQRALFKWWKIDALGLGLCLGFALVVYMTMVAPLMRRSASDAAHQQELDESRISAAQLTNERTVLDTKLTGLQAALQVSPLRLQSPRTINRHLASLMDLAQESALNIDQIKPGRPQRGARYVTVPIRLTGNGTYRACTQFLHDLHARFGDTAIRSFELLGDHTGRSMQGAQFKIDLAWRAAPTDMTDHTRITELIDTRYE